MPTIFVNGVAIPLQPRQGELAGDPILVYHAQILDEILHRRVKAKLRYLLERGELYPQDVQAKAEELCAQDLKPYATLDDSDDEDPILIEAMIIARDIIISRMAAEGLPPPKNLDLHAKQLVDNLPHLQEQARKRVEDRYRAATEVLESE